MCRLYNAFISLIVDCCLTSKTRQVNAVVKRSTGDYFAIKRVEKAAVLKKDPTLYTVAVEFDIMTRVQSPFCLHLVHAFQTESELCLVMPFMRGTFAWPTVICRYSVHIFLLFSGLLI